MSLVQLCTCVFVSDDASLCVYMCSVNATCDLVSILAVSILWRGALEQKSLLILDAKKSPKIESWLSPLAYQGICARSLPPCVNGMSGCIDSQQ